jgi:RNA polymerase sigma-54 factor
MQQRLSPLQIQTIKLMELPVMQLEERVKEELEENPALEEEPDPEEEYPPANTPEVDDTPAYKLHAGNNYQKEPRPEFPTLSVKENFRQHLESQLGFSKLKEHEHNIALFLIGSLDDDGYLRRDLHAIVDDLAFRFSIETSAAELERLLLLVQDFDPAGVGARSLQECLLIQLKKSPHKNAHQRLAEKILTDCFHDFAKKHYDKILQKMQISEDALKAAIAEIVRLNPRPGSSIGDAYTDQARQIIPDFNLEIVDGQLQLSLLKYNIPQLHISRKYAEMMENAAAHTAEERAAAAFVKQKMEAAARFIEALKQRRQTLLITVQAIVDYQHAYFIEGDESKLRPMVLKHIAERTGFDISTISRVVNSKFIQTHFGVFSLKYFFSEGMKTTSGEEVSTHEIKNILQESIDKEDKKRPLADIELAAVLREKGYAVARRTVAKYREMMNIPVARLRKKL